MTSSVEWVHRMPSSNRLECVAFLEEHGFGGIGPHLRLRIQQDGDGQGMCRERDPGDRSGGDGKVVIAKGLLPVPEENQLLQYVSNQFHHIQELLGTVRISSMHADDKNQQLCVDISCMNARMTNLRGRLLFWR